MMYRIDVLVQGFPGKSVCHGGLGWSTIALLRSPERCILVDVGSFGVRKHLARQLKRHGVIPSQVTDVILTHAHYDHSVNFVLFDRATIWIGAEELRWAAARRPDFDPLPELYVDALDSAPQVRRINSGDKFLPGFEAVLAPGHTPGSLVFYLTANPVPVIFTGDAAKNRAELISRTVDMSEDEAASRASIETIWQFWRRVPGTLLIPGHDLTMRLDESGNPVYVGERRAGISVWFGETIDDTTEIRLDNLQANVK
jgi:glyoxylase-like metal-dependent hydrolase (beta-lactamase superfamily II)